MGIFSVYPGIITFPADFPIQRYGGRYNGKRHSACLHGKRPAAFRNLCQIGHSNRFPLATFASCPLCPPWKGIVKISRKREAARLQTKGKIKTIYLRLKRGTYERNRTIQANYQELS
jgi:hypothetical protein